MKMGSWVEIEFLCGIYIYLGMLAFFHSVAADADHHNYGSYFILSTKDSLTRQTYLYNEEGLSTIL